MHYQQSFTYLTKCCKLKQFKTVTAWASFITVLVQIDIVVDSL